MAIKTLKSMLKDADKSLLGGTMPIVFLDTSAIIDICKSAREEEAIQKKKKNIPLQEIYADHFLMNFAGKYQTIISPLTNSEIGRHYCVSFNGNIKEIQESICPLVEKFSIDYERLKQFVFRNVPDDRDKYNLYWVTKFALANNRKKDLEGFSEVDKEILENAILFSKYFSKEGKGARPVVVFSSDEHIFKGVEMLKELGYDNVITLSSRSKKNGRK